MVLVLVPITTVQIFGTKSKNQHFLCKYCRRMYSLMQYLHRNVNIWKECCVHAMNARILHYIYLLGNYNDTVLIKSNLMQKMLSKKSWNFLRCCYFVEILIIIQKRSIEIILFFWVSVCNYVAELYVSFIIYK